MIKSKHIITIKKISLIVAVLALLSLFPFTRYSLISTYEYIFNIEFDELLYMSLLFRKAIKILLYSSIIFLISEYYSKVKDYSIIYPAGLILFFLLSCLNFFSNENFRGYHGRTDFGDFVYAIEGYANGSVLSSNYPPLAVAFYKIINLSLSKNEEFALYGKNTWLILMFIISIVVIFASLRTLLNTRLNSLIAASMMVSGPMIFLYERANILIIAFAFTLLFLCLYNSQDSTLRYFSFFALALAANLKYYPAIFGLLLLKQKRFKDAFICASMGIFLFISPILFENSYTSIVSGGTGTISKQLTISILLLFSVALDITIILLWDKIEMLLKSLVQKNKYIMLFALAIMFFATCAIGIIRTLSSESRIGKLIKGSISFSQSVELGATNSLRDCVYRTLNIFNMHDDSILLISNVLLIMFIIISIVVFFLSKTDEASLFMLAIMCIAIPSVSFEYSNVFLLPPMCSYISTQKRLNALNVTKSFLYIIALSPMYWIDFPFKENHMWHTWLLWIILIISIYFSVVKEFRSGSKESV